MNDLPLFRSLQPETPRRPPDVAYIRKTLHWQLRFARDAQYLPWTDGEASHWERFFPILAAYLPSDEAEKMVTQFRTELSRLRSAQAELGRSRSQIAKEGTETAATS